MIIPIIESNEENYIKNESFFIDLYKIDDEYYHFYIYFDFLPELFLKNNILNLDFEIIDRSLVPNQQEINDKLKLENLPLDENTIEYENEKEKIEKVKADLILKSSIFNKIFNISKSINNSNKLENKLIKKQQKINKNSNSKLENYKNIYLEKNGHLKLDDFKSCFEYDFLIKNVIYNEKYVTFKDTFKIKKKLFNSNSLTIILNLKNSKFIKQYQKDINISDIIEYITQNKVLDFAVKENKNSNIIKVNNSEKIDIKKKNLIDYNYEIIQSIFSNNILEDKNNPNKNILYKASFKQENNIVNSIEEFVINDHNSDYKCLVNAYNYIQGISINVEILNNTNNDVFYLKKRNLTKKQKYEILTVLTSSTIINDTDVINNQIYEYSLYNDKDLNNHISTFVIERSKVKFLKNEFKVDKFITENDIQFKVEYLNNNNNFLSILKEYDLYDQYKELLNENNQEIKKMFYYKVERYNKSTGEFINLGWTKGDISDQQMSAFLNVKKANNVDDYLYFITAYNIFSFQFLNEKIEIIKNKDGRNFKFDKNKWLQPLLIEKAISSDNKTRLSLFGKKDYEFGFTGETLVINASYNMNLLSSQSNVIINPIATRNYKNYITLEWNLNIIKDLDHVIITKLNNNLYEEIVDKTTSVSGRNTYFYKIDVNDIELKFNIIPVKTNFNLIGKYTSNTVLV